MQEKTIKILQVLPYSYHIHRGGLEKIAQTLSDGLNNLGNFELKNLASDVQKGEKKDFTQYQDTIFQESFDLVPGFPVTKFWQKSFWTQIRELKDWKPDVIMTHTRFFLSSMIGGIFAKICGCKRVHIEHGSGFVVGYLWYIKLCAWLFDWTIGLWIFRQCDTVVTISEMHKQFISKFTSKEPVVIYNPVENIKKSSAFGTSFNKEEQKVLHIGFIGRLVPLKGVDILIDALKYLEGKERKCTIVGTGSQDDILKQQVIDLSLGDRIIFVGADDRANRLPKFDMFVNPSYQEGVPTTVVEALLAGCIVVASDVGGTREISDKEDLILVESGNVEALQGGIEKAFDSLNRKGESYELVMERFGVEKAVQSYRQVIKHLIGHCERNEMECSNS